MALIVEDGTGVSGAESYAAVATVTAYWAARPHRTQAAAWSGASDAAKEGAAREASQYLDAIYGAYYRGTRDSYDQGLLWPRSDALDDAGDALPDLPPQIVSAACELAARAVSAPLIKDAENANGIKRKRAKAGPAETETEYSGSAMTEPRYGAVGQMLAPVLNGAQPGAPRGSGWAWA